MLDRIDDFFIEQTEKVVQLAQDWLYLSQKWVEWVLMIVFILVCVADVLLLFKGDGRGFVGWEVAIDSFFLTRMWGFHRESKAERSFRRSVHQLGRVTWIGVILGIFVIDLMNAYIAKNQYIGLYDSLSTIWTLIPCLMMYVTILDVDGERGKAAKLSRQKLKELFGNVNWVPEPQKG